MSERHSTGRLDAIETALAGIRTNPQLQVTLIVIGVLVGFAVALAHWVGFVLAGAAIGLVTRTLGQAIVVAMVAGGIAIVTFLGHAWWHDQLLVVLSFGELTIIAVLVPLVLIVFGSLVRGVT